MSDNQGTQHSASFEEMQVYGVVELLTGNPLRTCPPTTAEGGPNKIMSLLGLLEGLVGPVASRESKGLGSLPLKTCTLLKHASRGCGS